MTNPKRPRDPNQLAHLIAGIATGEVTDSDPNAGKSAAAIARGKKGGEIGGKKRMSAMTDEQKQSLAVKAATARWGKKEPPVGGSKTVRSDKQR